MNSGTLALWIVGVMAIWFAAWMWACWTRVQDARAAGRRLSRRTDELEKRIAGVEALMVSTVGQETEDFCRAMDALMERMEEPEAKQKPAPKPKEKLSLSEQYCGAFKPPKPDKWRGGKKGASRG